MKAIVQEHTMGCGLACVAAAAGVTYDRVLDVVHGDYAGTRGYYCKDLIDALRILGREYTYGKVPQKNKHYLRINGVIVFVALSKKNPAGHYLLRTKNGWMNPWINSPEIAPAKAGFQKKLPGTPQWILFPR